MQNSKQEQISASAFIIIIAIPLPFTDFLPVRCDACDRIFCIGHYPYNQHGCALGRQRDVQVPVCPLCSAPVPTAKDVSPDLTVGQHIDQFCRSERRKIFTNRCSMKGCKKRELIPVVCGSCSRNYCLRHRHTADHNCDRTLAAQRGSQQETRINREAAAQRRLPTFMNQNHIQSVQGTMSEDEALAHAMALSMLESTSPENVVPNANQQSPQMVPCGGEGSSQNNLKDKCSLS